MEKLHRRSDGIYETDSGLFGIQPLRGRTYEDGTSNFKFVGNMAGPTVEVVWTGPIAVIESETAMAMVGYGYAQHITDEQMDAWNAEVEAWLEEQAQQNQGSTLDDDTDKDPGDDLGDPNQPPIDPQGGQEVTPGQTGDETLPDPADTTSTETTSEPVDSSEQSPDTGSDASGSRKRRK